MSPSKAVGCTLLLSVVLVVGLGAPDATAFQRAKADLRGPNGITGTARLVEDANGNVLVTIHVTGHPAFLTPGRHGVHIHEVGLCELPGFTTAGGHFDPGPFGNSNTVTNHPFHSGDLENLVVNRDGVGRLIDVTTRVTLSPSDLTVFDANAARSSSTRSRISAPASPTRSRACAPGSAAGRDSPAASSIPKTTDPPPRPLRAAGGRSTAPAGRYQPHRPLAHLVPGRLC